MELPPPIDIAQLENHGFFVINDAQSVPEERTLIVLGVARSGTTMVSGALHHLGIYMGMGEKPNSVFEDVALSQAVEGNDTAKLKELIAARNADHKVWGWKRPSAIHHLGRIGQRFRNPQYIVLFRDIFAIANRNRISVRTADIIGNMEDSLRQYADLLAFLRTCESRALLISYEKAMLRPGAFVHALAAYAGVSQRGHIRKAREFLRAKPLDYLVTSRNWGGMGHIERLEPHQVSGWAALRGEQKIVRVNLWINGEHVATSLADEVREDIKARGAHPTGVCGFKLVLPEQNRLRDGDTVRVRIEGEVKDLHGSPRRYVAASKPASTPPPAPPPAKR